MMMAMKTMTMMTMMVTVTVMVMASGTAAFRSGVIHFHQDMDTHHPIHILRRPPHPDRGYMENCGKGGGYYDFSWFPKEFSPMDKIKIFANITSPADLDAVHLKGEVLYEGSKMLFIDATYRCEDLAVQVAQAFPREGLRLDCPIRKGEQLGGSFVFTDTEQIIGYDGNYELKLTIKDLNGRSVMCINVKLTILPLYK